jgi:hypothetical protein
VRPVFFDLNGTFCYDAMNFGSSAYAKGAKPAKAKRISQQDFFQVFCFLYLSLSWRFWRLCVANEAPFATLPEEMS